MACFDENTVIAFFASPRDGALASRVDAHAADCAGCREYLAAYASLNGSDTGSNSVPYAGTSAKSFIDSEVGSTGSVRTAGSSRLIPESAGDDSLGRRLAQAQAAKRVGQWLGGKWRIERLLGVGGMAQVFAATHRNGKLVAVKLMRPELAVEPMLVQRFLREAYAANRVAHPGAVAVHDDDKADDGVPFLVMDLLEGRTLRERIVQSGPLGLEDAARVIDHVLDVLIAAHAKGIVHRDIKPENLFETAQGTVRVLDFGIARLMESTGMGEGMTRSGMTMGTIGYMPPEQARGQVGSVDARSDLWAVGATLYNLMTGRAVHEASTHNEVLLLAMTAKVPPVRTTAPSIPSAVAKVIDKALAFDKSSRWNDAKAMQDALREALDADRASLGRAPRKHRRALIVVSGMTVAAAVATFAVSARSPRETHAPSAVAVSSIVPQAVSSQVSPATMLPPAIMVESPKPAPVPVPMPTAIPMATPKSVAPRARIEPKGAASAAPKSAPPENEAPAAAMNPLGPRT